MPRARLIDPARYRAELRARRTVRHLRVLAAQVRGQLHDTGDVRRMRELHVLLSNGAWAVEDLFGWHPKEED